MRRGTLAIAAALLACAAVAPVRAGDVPKKKIAVLEKIIDTSLIESKSALVYAGGVVDGAYVPGFGAIFKLEFSFVEKSGQKILDNLDNMDSLKVYWRDMIGMGEKDSPAALHRREQLNQIEDELVETVMNYGATLGDAMGADEALVVLAFPWQDTWDVTPDPVGALIVRARYGDLQAFAAGKLSAEKTRERITVTEETK